MPWQEKFTRGKVWSLPVLACLGMHNYQMPGVHRILCIVGMNALVRSHLFCVFIIRNVAPDLLFRRTYPARSGVIKDFLIPLISSITGESKVF
jgi:hypothetical protein